MDNILVEAVDLTDLENKIRLVLERCREHGFVLSEKKFEIGTMVEFAGFSISANGISPCKKQLEAIALFPTPSNVSSLRGFLGLVNQLHTFIPNLSALTEKLQGLLKKGISFQWLPDHQVAFEAIKKSLVNEFILHHYTKLVTDASQLNGIGFVLMQTDPGSDSCNPKQILQCGSRSLSLAEKNYSMVELECLGIWWTLHKCNHFICGIPSLEVLTDHQPLVGIFSKALCNIDNPRILRLCEQMLAYLFNVCWIPGKANIIADAFSCIPVAPIHLKTLLANLSLVC